MTEPVATIAHVRAAGFCIRHGARPWALAHGVDWSRFLREGIAISQLESIGDALAMRVVAEARRGSQE